MPHEFRSAFSLVELSIVLVILGLLTGGILAGQSLIRAAELRSVGADYQRYVTALSAFRDKYFAIPGDMINATQFWGKDNTNCSGDTGTAATPGTCNGNGNAQVLVGSSYGVGSTGECFQFWKQLALAGLIEGQYTGLSGPGNVTQVVPGTNAPLPKISNAGWAAYYTAPDPVGTSVTYAGSYGNMLIFGGARANATPEGQILKPEEAWNIDSKLDDGKPGTGRMIGAYWGNNCATGGASATDTANSVYKLNNSNAACLFYFVNAF